MSDIEKLKTAFDEIGIDYTVRKDGEYEYLFIGERRDIHSLNKDRFNDFLSDSIDTLIGRHKFFEFENGSLASYFNS